MVPLSALVTTQWVAGSRHPSPHFNGFPPRKINGNPAPGSAAYGDALAAMEATARESAASRLHVRVVGARVRGEESGGTSMIAFVFGLLIVFLVLAAQYESWTLPGAVMSAVPFGILGALVTNWLRGLENDVYFQIGLLVLIASARRTPCCACRQPSNSGTRARRSWKRPSWRVSSGCGRSS
jgi:multidrug efflux pump